MAEARSHATGLLWPEAGVGVPVGPPHRVGGLGAVERLTGQRMQPTVVDDGVQRLRQEVLLAGQLAVEVEVPVRLLDDVRLHPPNDSTSLDRIKDFKEHYERLVHD